MTTPATTMKLQCGTRPSPRPRITMPTTSVASHSSTPDPTAAGARRVASRISHPTASPMRNGHAVPQTWATPSPSECAPRPKVENTTTSTASSAIITGTATRLTVSSPPAARSH